MKRIALALLILVSGCASTEQYCFPGREVIPGDTIILCQEIGK